MMPLKYHETVLHILEQHKAYDWEKVKSGLERHEAWIKSLSYIHLPDMPGYGADRCYCKLYCCGLLQRSLQLFMQTAALKVGIKGKGAQKAAWEILDRVIALGELIRSLESIYQHFDTINDRN